MLNKNNCGEAIKKYRQGSIPKLKPPRNHVEEASLLLGLEFLNIHQRNSGITTDKYDRVATLKANNKPLAANNHQGDVSHTSSSQCVRSKQQQNGQR